MHRPSRRDKAVTKATLDNLNGTISMAKTAVC